MNESSSLQSQIPSGVLRLMSEDEPRAAGRERISGGARMRKQTRGTQGGIEAEGPRDPGQMNPCRRSNQPDNSKGRRKRGLEEALT